MHNLNAFHVSFLVRKKKNDSGFGQVYARIRVNGRGTEFSIKHEIEINQWCNKSAAMKGASIQAQTVNNSIEQIKARLHKAHKELVDENKFVTANLVKSRYFGTDSANKTLIDLLNYHNNRDQNPLTEGTLKNYDTTQRYLLDFIERKRKSTNVFLKEINYEFIIDFETYLRKKSRLNNNGLMKHMERFKKLLNLAHYMEWIDKNPGVKYKLKFVKHDRAFLNEEELEKIKNASFVKPSLEINKDIFLFACYTGFSYIDVYNLTANNIHLGIDGQKWIYTSRQKSKIPVKVPLLEIAIKIIEKYNNHPNVQSSGKLFPTYSNQKTNSYLKKVAEILKIQKNLSFHVARHTFATTVTLSNGVPIETVSKLLGHTKIATTQIYARVIDKKIAEDMGDLSKKLSDKSTQKKEVNVS